MKNLLSVTASEGLCNCRIKHYPDEQGNWHPVQKMTTEKKIFNPLGLEKHGYDNIRPKAEENPEELLLDVCLSDEVCTDRGSSDRARVRARSKILDLIRCNLDFRYFCTLTYDAEKVSRENYDEVVRKFSQWCDNRVRRKGLKYLAVIERHHQSNGLHFHVLTNSALCLVDSGTVKCPRHKKPIKIRTADRYGVPLSDRKTVFNISDWVYGFSTAIAIDGDPLLVKVGNYLRKYMTKDEQKVGGRWYYSGGALLRPRYTYCTDDFFSCDSTYDFSVAGNSFKVLLLE